MKRTTPWIVALRAREDRLKEWRENHPGSEAMPEEVSYSYSSVRTREVADKTSDDSFTCAVLPFKSDPWFLDAYISAYGRLRIGQIFQDLDALAGVIAYRHCSPAEPVIVTASVDRIYMLKRLDNIADYNVTLSGNVSWTGRSSMEITIRAARHKNDLNVEQIKPEDIEDKDVFLTANFTFVARDPETKRAFAINRLVPQTSQEQEMFVRAEEFNNAKKLKAVQEKGHVLPPTAEESHIIHDKWLRGEELEQAIRKHGDAQVSNNIVPMSKTRTYSTMMMQPQYRNRHSYMIFGGYLMRQTFELAYSCSASFSNSSPRFITMDTTTFKNPVPVGSVLYLTATVAYTQNTVQNMTRDDGSVKETPGQLIQVRVDSTVRDTESGTTTDTGAFVYSFFVEGQGRELLPETYNEMMEYVEGRRRALATDDFYSQRQLGRFMGYVSE